MPPALSRMPRDCRAPGTPPFTRARAWLTQGIHPPPRPGHLPPGHRSQDRLLLLPWLRPGQVLELPCVSLLDTPSARRHLPLSPFPAAIASAHLFCPALLPVLLLHTCSRYDSHGNRLARAASQTSSGTLCTSRPPRTAPSFVVPLSLLCTCYVELAPVCVCVAGAALAGRVAPRSAPPV